MACDADGFFPARRFSVPQGAAAAVSEGSEGQRQDCDQGGPGQGFHGFPAITGRDDEQ